MTNVYALYVIITSDNTGSTFCLSSDKLELILPIVKIDNVKYLHEEARYKLRRFFDDESIKFNEECSADYLCIQNILSVNYVSEYIENFSDNDLIITYGGVLLKNNTADNIYWHRLQYDSTIKGYSNNKNANLLIDNVIHKTLI